MELPSVLNNEQRFAVNNWTDRDFVHKWNGESVTIKAGETKEFDMAIAHHFTKHLVDREMDKDGKSASMGIDEARKVYEEKTITGIGGAVKPELEELDVKIREESDKMTSGDVDGTKKKEKKEKKSEKKVEKKTEFENLK